jgi:hypothetical protein
MHDEDEQLVQRIIWELWREQTIWETYVGVRKISSKMNL